MSRKEIEPKTALGRRIRQLRKAQSLTQEQVVRRGDVRMRTYSGIETGEIYDPHLSTLYAIARSLNVALIELFVDEPTGGPGA